MEDKFLEFDRTSILNPFPFHIKSVWKGTMQMGVPSLRVPENANKNQCSRQNSWPGRLGLGQMAGRSEVCWCVFFLSSPHLRQAVAPEHHWAVGWSFADSKHFGCWGRPSEDFHPLFLGVSINGNPPNGWFMMENPNLKWMTCGYPFWYPHFRKPQFFAHPGWPPTFRTSNFGSSVTSSQLCTNPLTLECIAKYTCMTSYFGRLQCITVTQPPRCHTAAGCMSCVCLCTYGPIWRNYAAQQLVAASEFVQKWGIPTKWEFVAWLFS